MIIFWGKAPCSVVDRFLWNTGTSTTVQGVTSQNTVIIVTAMRTWSLITEDIYCLTVTALVDTIQLVQSLRSFLPPPHIAVSSWKNEDKHRLILQTVTVINLVSSYLMISICFEFVRCPDYEYVGAKTTGRIFFLWPDFLMVSAGEDIIVLII